MSSNSIKRLGETQEPRQKHNRGAPKANTNAQTHGLATMKAALRALGSRAIDQRTSVGKALCEWKAEIVKDLGGKEAISAQKFAVLEILVRLKLMLDSIDSFILSQRTLVLKRKKQVIPIVKERNVLADSFVKHLATLGLERVPAPVPSLAEYLSEKDAEKAGLRKEADRGPKRNDNQTSCEKTAFGERDAAPENGSGNEERE